MNYWLLILYLTGSSSQALTVVPETFPSEDACRVIGQAWTRMQASHGTMGYACLRVERQRR